jgi:hypothetical protein
LVILGLILIYEKKREGILLASVGLALVILSHNLTFLMLIPFLIPILIALIIYSQNRLNLILNLVSFAVLSLGLAAVYWLPAITEMGLTKVVGQIGGGADFRNHFVYLDQLWASPWGFGGSAPGRLDGMSFMVGKIQIILATIGIILVLFYQGKDRLKKITLITLSFICLFVSVFFTNEISKPVWDLIRPMVYLQYPWRFLGLVTIAVSFIAGAIPTLIPQKLSKLRLILAGLAIISTIVISQKYFKPQSILHVSAADLTDRKDISWRVSRISDEYLPIGFSTPQDQNEIPTNPLEVVDGDISISDRQIYSNNQNYSLLTVSDSRLIANTAYYPWWHTFLDGKEIEHQINRGLIEVNVPPGEHNLSISYRSTLVQQLADFISSASILILFSLIGYNLIKPQKRTGPSRYF